MICCAGPARGHDRAARPVRAAAAAGLAPLAGSALQRFGTFEAGVASTKDPKYVVVPQRERLMACWSARRDGDDSKGV